MATRRLQIVFAASTRGALAGIRQVGGGISGLDRQLQQFSRRARDLSGLGEAMAGLGLAIKGAIAATTVASARFNKEMANVSTLVDTSQVSIARLKREVLALNPHLGESTELTKGLYQAISASIDPNKSVEFLAKSAKTAKAGLAEVFDSVDLLSTILNAYGKQVEETEAVSDILFKTVERGKTTIPELAGSMGRVIPIAASMDVKLEELAAIIATLTRGGLQTSEAVTSIKSAMANVIRPTERAREISQALGIDFGVVAVRSKGFLGFLGDIRDRFAQLRDPAELARLKLQILGANLEKVRDKKGKLTSDGERLVAMFQALEAGSPEEAMGALFESVEGLNAMLALTGKQADGVAADFKAMQNAAGATDVAFRKQTSTLAATWEALRNSFGKLMIQFGDLGEGPITSLGQRALSATESFRQWVAENEVLAQKLVLSAGAVGTFLLGLGGLMTVMPRVIAVASGVSKAFQMLAGPFLGAVALLPRIGVAATTAGGGVAALGAAAPLAGRALLGLVGGPVGAVIAGVSLLGLAWSRNLGGIREITTRWFGQMRPALVDGWKRLADQVKQAWAELSSQARFWFYRIVEEVRPALRAVQQTFGELAPDLKRIWDAAMAVLVPVAKHAIGNLVDQLRISWAAVKLTVSVAWELIAGVVKTWWGVISSIVKGAVGLVAGTVTAGMKLLQGDWRGAWEALAGGVSKAFNGINEAVRALIQGVLDNIAGMTGEFWNKGGELIQAVTDGMKSQGERTVETAADIGRRSAEALEQNFQPRIMGPWTPQETQRWGQMMQGAGQGVAGFGKQFFGAITQGLGWAMDRGKDAEIAFIRQYTRGSAVGDLSKMTDANRKAAVRLIEMAVAAGVKPIISSVTGGRHTDGSYHYSGQALDFGLVDPSGALLPYQREVELGFQLAAKAGYLRFIDELKTGSPHLHVSMGSGEGVSLQGGGPGAAGAAGWDLSALPGRDQTAAKKAAHDRASSVKWLEELRAAAQADILRMKDREFDAERVRARREAEEARKEAKDAVLTQKERAEALRLIDERLATDLQDIDKRHLQARRKYYEDLFELAVRSTEQTAEEIRASRFDLEGAAREALSTAMPDVQRRQGLADSARQMVDEARKRILEAQGNQRGVALLDLEREMEESRRAWKLHHDQLLRDERWYATERQRVQSERVLAEQTLEGEALAQRLASLQMEWETILAGETELAEQKRLLREQEAVIQEDFRIRRLEAERLAASSHQALWQQTVEQISTSFQQGLAQMLSGQISFGDFLKNLFQQILAAFANMVAQMVTEWLFGVNTMKAASAGLGGGVGGLLGGLFSVFGFSKGGFVPGLGRGDKVPALLEPGEFVVPRRVVEQAQRLSRPLAYAAGGLVPGGMALAGTGGGFGGPVVVQFAHHGDVRTDGDARALRRWVEESVTDAMRRAGGRL